VLHDFGYDWQRAYHAILRLGDNIIIETPPKGDNVNCKQSILSSIHDCVRKKPSVVIGQFTRDSNTKLTDQIVWISKKRTDLVRKGYIFGPNDSAHTFEIESNFKSKTLKKFLNGILEAEKKWLPGINLITFKSLNGTYPTPDMLVDTLSDIISTPSTDWFPHNVIIDGNHLQLIDTDDPMHKETTTWCFNEDLYGLMLDTIYANSEYEIMELYRVFLELHIQ